MSKVSIKLTRALRSLRDIQKEFNRNAQRLIGLLIDQEIGKGLSPVAGWGRYDEYSSSYQAAIKGGQYAGKKVRPVNLYLTGKLRKSQRVGTRTKEGGEVVTVSYTDKKAAYHNDGIPTKRGVIRRPLIPTKPGEKFSRTIDRRLYEIAKKSVAKILGKS